LSLSRPRGNCCQRTSPEAARIARSDANRRAKKYEKQQRSCADSEKSRRSQSAIPQIKFVVNVIRNFSVALTYTKWTVHEWHNAGLIAILIQEGQHPLTAQRAAM